MIFVILFLITLSGWANESLYFDLPDAKSFPIVLIIPGSQKEPVKKLHDSLKGKILELGFCPVSLEKEGDSLQKSIEDHLQLLKKLKGLIGSWNGEIAILGQGDGGRIGAEVACKSESVKGLVLIGSGGLWPPLQEMLHSFRSELADQGFSPRYIQGFLVQAKEEFERAIQNPSSEKMAFGFNYQYWESLSKMNLPQTLSSLQCPIYFVSFTKDDRLPIESADLLAQKLKEKITYVRKDGPRDLLRDPSIYNESLSWIQRLLK